MSSSVRNFWAWFGGIWLLVGVPFLFVSGYQLQEERRLSAAGVTADGLVVAKHLDRSGRKNTVRRSIEYSFLGPGDARIDGRSDVPESIWNAVEAGSSVQILYLPDHPETNRPVGASRMTLVAIFMAVGGVLSLVGGSLLAAAVRNARTRRRLLATGIPVPAVVAEVGPTNIRINRQPLWRLRYDYKDYRSQPHRGAVSMDAGEAAGWKPGDTGTVLFDPNRPSTAIWMGRQTSK